MKVIIKNDSAKISLSQCKRSPLLAKAKKKPPQLETPT